MDFNYRESDFTPVPPGNYNATIESVEEAEGQYGPQLKWTLALGEVADINGKVQARSLAYWTPRHPTGRNKLGKMIGSLGLDPKTISGTNELLHRQCVLTVITEPRRDGDGLYNKIVAVSVPGQPAQAQQAAQPAQPIQFNRQAPPPPMSDEEWQGTAADAFLPTH